MDSLIIAYLALAASGLSNAMQIWNFFQSPSKKNEAEIGSLRDAIAALRREAAAETVKIDDKVDALATRVNTIESDMRHLPDQEATHRLEVAIAKLDGRIETLDERLKPVAAISERMQELMLSEARKPARPVTTRSPR